MKKLTNANYKTSNWSGGTSTELYIYPENADYTSRNFLWRISSATVEIEKSNFTKLPGVKRIILPLDGVLKLNHVGIRRVELKPFEQDVFSGDWLTESEGKVTDFNVMTKSGVDAKLTYLKLQLGETKSLIIENGNAIKYFIYCIAGEIKVGREMIVGNESLVIDRAEYDEVILKPIVDSELLLIKIENDDA
jgi:environmental stress-induced protein Ves